MSVWDWMERRASPAQRLAALDEAIDTTVRTDFGDWRVPWGQINRYQRNDGAIDQVFDDKKPSTPIPFASARWGSLASFGARRYPGTTRYYGTSGNSFVAVVEFGPRVTARAVSIGGESNDPASPHFADQVDRLCDGQFAPGAFLARRTGRAYGFARGFVSADLPPSPSEGSGVGALGYIPGLS